MDEFGACLLGERVLSLVIMSEFEKDGFDVVAVRRSYGWVCLEKANYRFGLVPSRRGQVELVGAIYGCKGWVGVGLAPRFKALPDEPGEKV